MAGFKAQGAVAPLDYDFNPYVKAKGTTPEPSTKELADLIERVSNTAKAAGIDISNDAEEIGKALANATREQTDKMQEEMVEAISEVCKGSPTREQIESLPGRIQTLYFESLLDDLTDPTKSNGATRR